MSKAIFETKSNRFINNVSTLYCALLKLHASCTLARRNVKKI